MDYLYENLGDERFQEFCSALISKEFPDVQSFPVGQPDGGRDSIAFLMNSGQKEFIVFQVKFVRNANEARDIHNWLIATLKEEAGKIDKLIPKGAIKYYLLTNIKGTAHLDSGSKDKINAILEEEIKIPALCWWRDDISRLFEKDPLFKWSFPEILNGQDVLNSVLFESINENKERRESVIRAYLIDQFEIDNEVKFKQIDLQNRILNLFTDVPLRVKKFNEKNKKLKRTIELLVSKRKYISDEEEYFTNDNNGIGAAEFLLHSKVQTDIQRILLEGGPGQGKSTITQYVCQVHHARLLKKLEDIDLIPINLRNSPRRLPFKIDLRDIATWIERKNPYSGALSQEYFDSNWKSSLEAFLVTHIFYHSKLDDFSATDFIAICKLSPVLFVFDGFDEIANLELRTEVIDFINKGVARISSNAKSIQVIVTSRPAAFSDSVGFSIDIYPHFELSDISPLIINEYVEKWIIASRIDSRDAAELRRLIKEKLEMPHLKDLAKSPMQLAIFISLLKTKGQSLPNKRTALYDSYIELFFDRESEKNSLIRDKRDLIIDIHQYLAWLLHSEAELFKNNGRILIADLNYRLKDYLSTEGHDPSIADQLFIVMNERVCALVSRVQGSFEFEVQPLREYFCAKYLYKSAPHSSAGEIKCGTKPDRFHAILRSFYWQNVVRFFAGCADAGELDMIIQELKDLQEDRLLKYTNFPRIITAQILSDFVFTQKPLKLRDVVEVIVDGINIKSVINQDGVFGLNDPLRLPIECGRAEVVIECFRQLSKFPNNDYTLELIGIISNNPLNNMELWLNYSRTLRGKQLTKWLEYAYRLQLIYKMEESVVIDFVKEGDEIQIKKRLQILVRGGRLDIIENNIEYKQLFVSGILESELAFFDRKNKIESLIFLSLTLNPYIFSNIFNNPNSNITLLDFLQLFSERRSNSNEGVKTISEFSVNDEVDQNIKGYSKSIGEVLLQPISKFRESIDPWDCIIESARTNFTDGWAIRLIATIAAGIKSKEELYDEFSDLTNSSLSLCKRVRCARMKSGNIKYWEEQLNIQSDLKFVLLVFFSWATPKNIIQFLPIVNKLVKDLTDKEYLLLFNGLDITTKFSKFSKDQQLMLSDELENGKVIDEVKYLISQRFEENEAQFYVYSRIKKVTGVLQSAIIVKYNYLIEEYLKSPTDTVILAEIKKLYKNIYLINEYKFYRFGRNIDTEIPYDIAKKIMKNCKDYPIILSSLAEKSCRIFANKNLKPVGEIAKNQNWF